MDTFADQLVYNFSFDKLPDTFYQVKAWAVWRYVVKQYIQLCGEFLYNAAFWYLALSSMMWTFFPLYSAAAFRSMAQTSVAVM